MSEMWFSSGSSVIEQCFDMHHMPGSAPARAACSCTENQALRSPAISGPFSGEALKGSKAWPARNGAHLMCHLVSNDV